MSEYNAAKDGHDSYYAAIEEKRRRKEWTDRLTAAKRVVFIGDCIMIEGDCLEVMPQIGKVDACLTDPPYGIGAGAYTRGGTQYGASKAPSKTYDLKDWDNRAPQEIVDFILSMKLPTIIFGGNYFNLPPSKCWLVWDKQNGDGSGYADCELAWTNLDKAVRRIYWRWAGMLQKNMGDKKEERVHPTQKPVGVKEWCIGHFPEGTKTILDPFMGSGTTGVACVKTGRKFIGIELDPDYFDIACKRVREAYAQPDFFIEAKPKPAVQEGLAL